MIDDLPDVEVIEVCDFCDELISECDCVDSLDIDMEQIDE